MSVNARLRDCPLVLAYTTERLERIVDARVAVGQEFTFEEQMQMVDFFMTLTDEEMALVCKYAFLLRGD